MAEQAKKKYNLITKKRGIIKLLNTLSRSKIMNISKKLLNIGLKKIIRIQSISKKLLGSGPKKQNILENELNKTKNL